MASGLPKHIRLIGWVNLSLGLASPFRVVFHGISALQVFSYSWCGESLWLMGFLFGLIGLLSGFSGWGILKEKAWARRMTAVAGGVTLGYSITGVFIMLQFGMHRGLGVLIRNGSLNWTDWAISHFQSPSILEIPLMIWWIICLGTIIPRPEPKGNLLVIEKNPVGWGWVIGFGIIGGIARWIQIGVDVQNYSQR